MPIKLCAMLFMASLAACVPGEHPIPAVTDVAHPAAPASRYPFVIQGSGETGAMLMWLEPAAGDAEAGSPDMRLKWSSWDGTRWTEPELITEGRDFFVNWADFPSLAAVDDAPLAAHWLQRVPGGTYAYHVNMAFRSASGGWSKPLTPHLDRSASEHGFVTLVPLDRDRAFAIWLDGYRTTGAGHEDDPRAPQVGASGLGTAMTLRSAVIHRDGSHGEEMEVDASVCDCCQTGAARSGNRIIAVYRNRTADEIRDIYRAVYDLDTERWSEPLALSTEGWEIAGCPVNGPQVAAFGETVIAAWFSAPEGRPRSYAAVSRDGGRTFSAAQALQEGDSMGRVGIAFNRDGAALLTWVGSEAGRSFVHGRIWRQSGLEDPFVIGEIDASRASGFPRAAGLGDGFLVAWTEPDQGIRTALVTPRGE